MDIEQVMNGDIEVVYPIARIDTVTAKDFEKYMREAIDRSQKIIISFSKIDYVSSAGLRVMLISGKLIKAKGGSLVLCDMAPKIFEVFKMSGFDKILNIQSDLATAQQVVN